MTRLSALPAAREQAHHALTLLGVAAPLPLVAAVHGGLFDGDLTVGRLGELLRRESEAAGAQPTTAGSTYRLCPGLRPPGLTPVPGVITLSGWPLERRIVTAVSAHVDALTAIVRVAEFVAVRAGASPAAQRLLRRLAAAVPHGPEAYAVMDPRSLADAARAALADPRLSADAATDLAARQAVAARAEGLDERQRLFGVWGPPQQSIRRGEPGLRP